MKRKLLIILYGIGLTAFTAYIALDTFVLSSAYQVNTTEINTAMFDDIEKAELSENTDENIADTQNTTEANTVEGTLNDTGDGSVTDDSASVDSADSAKDGSNTSSKSSKKGRPSKPNAAGKRRSKSGHGNESSDTETSGTTGSEDTSGTVEESDSRISGTNESDSSTSEDTTTDSTSVESTSTDKNYQDENISITLKEYDYNGTAVYVADVQLSSAEYLKTAFADDTYGKNVTDTTSSIAENNNAILAINGDYYGVQETGYVIRNGIVYRDTADDNDVLCIYADGSMKIVDPSTVTADELVEQGVWQAFSFGPGLIENGSITVSEDDEVGKAKSSNPRTAIGMIDDLHYVFVVSDGRTDESEGLSLYELSQFMESLGVETAYNLDGGGSSTMVFEGELINNPTTSGNSIKERGVSDIVYIG